MNLVNAEKVGGCCNAPRSEEFSFWPHLGSEADSVGQVDCERHDSTVND